MKALLVALSATCALVVAAPAEAKELSAFKACGAAGCKTVKDTALLRKLIRSIEAQGNPVSVPIPAPAAYLRLEFWVRGDQARRPSFVQYYVPARGLVSLQTDPDVWTWVRAGGLRLLLDRAILGVTPFAKPRISGSRSAASLCKGRRRTLASSSCKGRQRAFRTNRTGSRSGSSQAGPAHGARTPPRSSTRRARTFSGGAFSS
jgi:hypothetical protein